MNPPTILYIETATEVCSVCVAKGFAILSKKETREGNQHSKVLGLYIQLCLQEAQIKIGGLSAITVCSGPGSYTGLRVGASVAKGLCYAASTPLIAIDNLEALAWGTKNHYSLVEKDIIISMIDARRMEVYLATFDHQANRLTDNKPFILRPDSFDEWTEKGLSVHLVGNGVKKALELYKGRSEIHCHLGLTSSSTHMIAPSMGIFKDGNFSNLFQFAPGYLKPPNITKSTKSII